MKADTHDLAQEKEHVHGHQTIPSDLALRVKALESCWSKRGWSIPIRAEFYANSASSCPRTSKYVFGTAQRKYATWYYLSGPQAVKKLSEEELAGLVTRDAMVGVAKVNLPQPGANL
jgi:hypothetical protein